MLRKYTRKKKFRAMAADMLDTGNLSRYLGDVQAAHAKGSPRLWGLHNYGDVNRRRTTFTKLMLRSVPGEVWLTETGGIVKLSPSFRRSPVARQGAHEGHVQARQQVRHEAPRPALEDHAPVRLHMVRRGPAAPASTPGLVNPDGTPRPAFTVFKKNAAKHR